QDIPRILATTPENGAINVGLNSSISANELFLPNGLNGIFGVENTSITNQTVKLTKVSTGTEIPATVNGTGGGDGINLTPSIPLEINTEYRFVVDGVTDLTGVTFDYYEGTFTTAADNTGSGSALDNVSFSRIGDVATGAMYTSLTVGPDGRLYGLRFSGEIDRWTINADGTLADQFTITTLPDATPPGGAAPYGSRAAVGLTFAPTSTALDLVAYVSHAEGVLNNGASWDGKISRLSGPNLETEELIVTNLPRSRRDHLTNSISFRSGEPQVLYFNQGSNTAGGAPDNSWGNRKERLLTAATLRLDLDLLPQSDWPLDAKTTMNQAAINNVDVNSPTLGTGMGTYTESGGTFPDDGTYNPFYVNAPLTIFATGIRNAYDLVWHSNGQLYVPNNGTAGGSNTPASVDGTRRIDGTIYDHQDPNNNYPEVPATTNNNTQRDFLFRIDPNTPVGYYGHPNPLRGEFVLNRGPVDVNGYGNNVSPDVNFRGVAFDFEFNKSPNGVIEYTSNSGGGALQGAMLVCRYSGGSDIIALVPNGPNGDILTSKVGIPGFGGFLSPLDITENPANGNLYVSDFGRQSIVLLKPSQQSTPEPAIQINPAEIVIDDVVDGNPTAPQTIFVTNTGNAALLNPVVSIIGADSMDFLLDASSLPTSLDAGQTVSITLALNASGEGPRLVDLSVTGDNAVAAVTIDVRGLGKDGTGGASEPSLQYIFDTYGLPINVGDLDVTTNLIELPGGLTYNDLLGDEADFQRFQAATDAPVEIEILSVFGPEAADPITGFGWYDVNNPATTNELFTLQNTAGNGQTLNPTFSGSLSFHPQGQVFGFYSRWPFFGDRRVNLEDAFNTFPDAIPNHVRVYEIPGQDNVYILAFEEHTSGFDYQDLVVIVRNVEPVIFSPEPFLSAAPEELVFQAVVQSGDRTQETKTFTVTNTGASDLVVTGVQLTGADAGHFTFAGPTSLTLAPAASQNYSITFAPPLTTTDLGYKEAALTFTSNATNAPVFDFGLFGLKQSAYGGSDEPPLQDIVNTLGHTVDVGWTTLTNTTDPTPQGEEVAVPLFEAAGSGPVTITALARFSPDTVLPFGWYSNLDGEIDLHPVGDLGDGLANVQSLYPPQTTGTNEFDPAGLFFGFYAGVSNMAYTEDQLNAGVAHRVRVYPARDRAGVLIQNSYLLCFEEGSDGDYQ
ncbi:MAG: choice-of-anchor D domain-containing protein, partial [Bacteroidota bacterium]